MENEEFLETFGSLAERWYLRHQQLFLYTIKKKSPIILYNNHADFQQNTVSQSMIGVGTGGFTEGYRNRVVMPVSPSNYETNHVLGHEMVHVFQYSLFQQSDSVGLRSMNNIPLWMIEGLAEYASIGDVDPQTAMWLRAALLSTQSRQANTGIQQGCITAGKPAGLHYPGALLCHTLSANRDI